MTDCIWVFAFVPGGLRSSKSIAQNAGCYSGLSDSIFIRRVQSNFGGDRWVRRLIALEKMGLRKICFHNGKK